MTIQTVGFQAAAEFMKEQNFSKCSSSKTIVSSYVNSAKSSKEDLSRLVVSMQSIGADIMKVVISATDITELVNIFHLLSHCQVQDVSRDVLFHKLSLMRRTSGFTCLCRIL